MSETTVVKRRGASQVLERESLEAVQLRLEEEEKARLEKLSLLDDEAIREEGRRIDDKLLIFEELLLNVIRVDPGVWERFKTRFFFRISPFYIGRFGVGLTSVMDWALAVAEENSLAWSHSPYQRTYLFRKLKTILKELERFKDGEELRPHLLHSIIERVVGVDDRTFVKWERILRDKGCLVVQEDGSYHVYPQRLEMWLTGKTSQQRLDDGG